MVNGSTIGGTTDRCSLNVAPLDAGGSARVERPVASTMSSGPGRCSRSTSSLVRHARSLRWIRSEVDPIHSVVTSQLVRVLGCEPPYRSVQLSAAASSWVSGKTGRGAPNRPQRHFRPQGGTMRQGGRPPTRTDGGWATSLINKARGRAFQVEVRSGSAFACSASSGGKTSRCRWRWPKRWSANSAGRSQTHPHDSEVRRAIRHSAHRGRILRCIDERRTLRRRHQSAFPKASRSARRALTRWPSTGA